MSKKKSDEKSTHQIRVNADLGDVDEFAKVPRPAGRKADPKKGKPKK